MSKNEVNYTPWGSLSMKNLVNRLSYKRGKQMLTDKNLLILPGRHQYECAGAEMRIWLSCFLSKGQQSFSELKYLDQKMKFGSLLRLNNTHSSHSEGIEFKMAGSQPQKPQNVNLQHRSRMPIFQGQSYMSPRNQQKASLYTPTQSGSVYP